MTCHQAVNAARCNSNALMQTGEAIWKKFEFGRRQRLRIKCFKCFKCIKHRPDCLQLAHPKHHGDGPRGGIAGSKKANWGRHRTGELFAGFFALKQRQQC